MAQCPLTSWEVPDLLCQAPYQVCYLCRESWRSLWCRRIQPFTCKIWTREWRYLTLRMRSSNYSLTMVRLWRSMPSRTFACAVKRLWSIRMKMPRRPLCKPWEDLFSSESLWESIMLRSNQMWPRKCEAHLRRAKRPNVNRDELKSWVSNWITNFLEEKSIKLKKKLIDKLLKMRRDNEDNPLGRKGAAGKAGFGEQ